MKKYEDGILDWANGKCKRASILKYTEDPAKVGDFLKDLVESIVDEPIEYNEENKSSEDV